MYYNNNMNNEFYTNYIDNLKDKLNLLQNKLFNVSLQEKKYTNSVQPSKHRDDTMALNNLLWKQKVSEYRATQKKINSNINYTPKEYNIIDNEEDLLDTIKKESYKTTWNRLDNYQKKEKIMEFVFEKKTKLGEDNLKRVQISIQDIIKKGNSKKIVYDNISSIQSIWCIPYDKDTDTFSFNL